MYRPHPKISVALITYNEAKNLQETLLSIFWADEIVIVDSGSDDGTVAIALKYGAKLYSEEWRGFSEQKNFAIEQCTNDWILSIDADEVVSSGLKNLILEAISGSTSHKGFYVRRRNYFLGRWIKHGGFYPDQKLRLFRKGFGSFEQRAVHENVKVDGSTGSLQGDLIHNAYPTLDLYVEHMNRYSSLGALEILNRQRKINPFINALLRPALNFVKNFIFRKGFLDGLEGLLLHLYHAGYVSWKYVKAWKHETGAKQE